MQAWRLCRAPFADLSGDGARLYGGRWNSPGRPLVYAADTAALAVLVVRVHLDIPPDLVPDDYVLVGVDLGGLPVETLSTIPTDPRRFGDAWLRERRTPILQVPSFIVPESSNLLFNPAHSLAGRARITRKRPFAFDRRPRMPG